MSFNLIRPTGIRHLVLFPTRDFSCTLQVCQTRQMSTNSTSDGSMIDSMANLKPYSEMPGPKGYPIIGNLWAYSKKDGYKFSKMFEAMTDLSEKYGPVFKERFGFLEHVVVSDPWEYAKVVRVDGPTPIRIELFPMAYYREQKGVSLGLVNGQGEEWYRHRSAVNRKMLRPMEVSSYVPQMDVVADDYMLRLKMLRTTQGHVPKLEKEMFKWAMESIGTVLFNERIGCLEDPTPGKAQAFIDNMVGFFNTMQPLMYSPPIYKLYKTKKWREFEAYADKLLDIGMSYVTKKLDRMEKQKLEGIQPDEREHKSEFLTYLITQKSLEPSEANALAADLLTGAVETTSTATLWTLYNLARFPKAQKTLFREICSVLPDRAPITAEALTQMPYVKACVRETFRLYPITFATSRIIEKDIELGGYHVPKGTHVQANLWGMGRNPELFEDPLTYMPDRWLRGTSSELDASLAFTNLPFGHGARMCIGRRFAEQEIYMILIKFIQNFRLEWHEPMLSPVLNTVMTPDRPMKLTLIPRD